MDKTTRIQEIGDLVEQWKADPIWDLEDTEGFEEFRPVLLEIRRRCEASWEQERLTLLEAKAEALGCPGNIALAAYVKNLEERLEERLAALERRQGKEAQQTIPVTFRW